MRRPSLGDEGGLVPFLVVLGLVVVAIEAQGAISWSSTSSIETQVTPPPLHLELGEGSGKTRYFRDLQLTDNRTGFTGEIKGTAGADLSVKDVLRLVNDAGTDRPMTLRAHQVSNANVEVLTWTIHDGSTTIATFDYASATPSASFTIPPDVSYTLDLRIDLADGAGSDNAGVALGLWMEVS